jgi:ADP-heptose:LPS heptosyltransferase
MSFGGALIGQGIQSFMRWSSSKEVRACELRTARRFLFLQYETALGTAVHATPLYEALRKAVPDAHVAVVASGIPFEVLRYNPHVDTLALTPHPLKNWTASLGYFLTKVRHQRAEFDCVMMDSGNGRSRLHLLALLSGIPCRLGFKVPWDFNHASLSYDSNQSVLQNNLRLLEVLGHSYEAVEPAVYFTQAELDHVKQLLKHKGIVENKPLVAFQTQTSGGEPNQWFDDRFIALADALYQQIGAQMIFLGAGSEISRVEALRAQMHAPSFSTAGCTDIPGLAALLSRCDLLVTLDTGTMHVGRAVKVPMVVIAHAKAPAHEWLPPATEHIRVLRRADVDCSPCRNTPCASRECMRRIQVSEVLEAVLAHLQKFPCSATARESRVSRWLRKDLARTSDPRVVRSANPIPRPLC